MLFRSASQGHIFSKLNASNVKLSGKTGTAQQSETHPDHGVFVGFAPSDNPEVAFAVRIANGYGSTYPTEVGNDVLEYYYGITPVEEIVTGKAKQIKNTKSGGD